jgi:hypothetical protein
LDIAFFIKKTPLRVGGVFCSELRMVGA